MPEAAAKPKLVVIAGTLHVGEPVVKDEKKLLHTERYLARQARAAHNLGLRQLEHQCNVACLSLRGWRAGEFPLSTDY